MAAGTLPIDTLAGKEPGVALSQTANDPVNYAMRGAMMALSGFADSAEAARRFPKIAFVPPIVGRAVYGLPETQSLLCRSASRISCPGMTLPYRDHGTKRCPAPT